MKKEDLMKAAEQAGWKVSSSEKSWVFTSSEDSFAVPSTNLADMCANIVTLAKQYASGSVAYQKAAAAFEDLLDRNTWECCDESCCLHYLPIADQEWKAIGVKEYNGDFVVCGCTVQNDGMWEDMDSTMRIPVFFHHQSVEQMDFAVKQHSYEDCEKFIKEWIHDGDDAVAPSLSEYNTLVYQKVFAEMEAYKSRLLALAPGEILDSAYEYSVKSDMLIVFEDYHFSISECKFMLSQENLLDQLFRKWEHRVDDPHMDELYDMMEGFCEEKEDHHA